MKLIYRGHSYAATPSTVKTQKSEAEGVFLALISDLSRLKQFIAITARFYLLIA